MTALFHAVGRVGMACFDRLPLSWVACLGRWGGAVAFVFDVRHRKVALENLNACFGHRLSPAALRALAGENFRRIGEAFACGLRTTGMPGAKIRQVVDLADPEGCLEADPRRPGENRILALGHFGNFEIFASFATFIRGFRMATTYRPLRPPALDRFHSLLRQRSGCQFFDRVTQGRELRTALARGGVLLGLLSDQHAGDRGLRLPFLGRECSCSTAAAVYARRYQARLFVGVCYRTGLGRWRVQVGPEIPVLADGTPRSVGDITSDINRVFEAAIERDPANWFWVHRRWKSRPAPRPASAIPHTQPDEHATP